MNTLEKMMSRAKEHEGFWIETAKLEITEAICYQMYKAGITKSSLAKSLKVNPSFVTKLLSGDNNFEISTLVRIARVLGCEIRFFLQPSKDATLRTEPASPKGA